jgi:hypothetical protein
MCLLKLTEIYDIKLSSIKYEVKYKIKVKPVPEYSDIFMTSTELDNDMVK